MRVGFIPEPEDYIRHQGQGIHGERVCVLGGGLGCIHGCDTLGNTAGTGVHSCHCHGLVTRRAFAPLTRRVGGADGL